MIEVTRERMIPKLIRNFTDLVGRLDQKVFDFSRQQAEKTRQKRLGKLMEGVITEYKNRPDDLDLVNRYIHLRSEYRRKLPLISSGSLAGESPWITQDGNKTENEFHELSKEIKTKHPDVFEKIGPIDLLIPLH